MLNSTRFLKIKQAILGLFLVVALMASNPVTAEVFFSIHAIGRLYLRQQVRISFIVNVETTASGVGSWKVENSTATAVARSYLLASNIKFVCCGTDFILFVVEGSETYPAEELAEFHAPNP